MGLFDELKKLTRPYSSSEYDDFSDEMPPEAPIEPQPRPQPAEVSRRYEQAPVMERRSSYAEFETRPAPSQRREKVVSFGGQSGGQSQMFVVEPERFETAADIADHIRSGHSVVMNLERTDKDTARRLIDFLSGVAYALNGKIRRVSANTYVITPYNVDISGDLMDDYAGGEYSGSLYGM